MPQLEWSDLKMLALQKAKEQNLDDVHVKKLKVEIAEFEKQGANGGFAQQYNEKYRYHTNKSGLILPWILGMTSVRPSTEHIWIQQTDYPDIDCDYLPSAREKIKEYAREKYGEDKVCSVAIYQTYKFRSAIQDVAKALSPYQKSDQKSGQADQDNIRNIRFREALDATTTMPDDVDEIQENGMCACIRCKKKHDKTKCKCGCTEVEDGLTIGMAIEKFEELAQYYHKDEYTTSVVDMAVRLIGKMKALSMHAGGLIISNNALYGNVPMAITSGHKVSTWTEGRNAQLSKFGYVKWDILGLRTLQYIYECCNAIAKNHNIRFNVIPWDGMDPNEKHLGYYYDADNNKHFIKMDDEKTFEMINQLRLETVFQFETDIQRGALANGVNDFKDLQIFNALGHPGPIDMIPDYVRRRNDTEETWVQEEHPEMAKMLKDTLGIIIFQEALAQAWRQFGGFTAPEAEAARKAVAKKWTHKLKPIKEQWIKGATKTLGATWAEEYWKRMETFGRYAFNKCLSEDTVIVDPKTGESTTIGELHKNPRKFHLLSYDREPIINEMVETIDNGLQEIYEVQLGNGVTLKTTLDHKLLCSDGEYYTIREIIDGDLDVISINTN
jgi:DNA polymerase-3 subunit alpha